MRFTTLQRTREVPSVLRSKSPRTADFANHTGAFLTFAFVYVARLCADVRFVCFDATGHLASEAVLHRQADTVKQKPSSLLGDAKRTMQLVGRNAVLRVRNQPERAEPFVQTNRRIFHDGANLDRELLIGRAMFALPNPARGNKRNLFVMAARASYNAVRPADADHKFQRPVFVREIANSSVQCLRKNDLFLGFHSANIPEWKGESSILLPFLRLGHVAT